MKQSRIAVKPGDIIIHKASIESMSGSNGLKNIMGQLKEISIYQSILNPVMTAEFYMFDGIGLLTQLPIIGEEYIDISLSMPEQDPIDLRFRVVSVKNRHQIDTETNGEQYTIYAVSEEYSNNTKMSQKIYTDRHAGYIIKDQLKSLGSKKRLYIDETGFNTYDLDTIGLNPLRAIDKARLNQRSMKDSASAFCFFETFKGFTFKSVEQMFTPAKTVKEYAFDVTTSAGNIDERDFRNVIGLRVLQDTAAAIASQKGVLNSEIRTFDVLTGSYQTKTYTESKDGKKQKKIEQKGSSLFSSTNTNKHGQDPAKTQLNLIDSYQADPNVHEFVLERTAFINKLTQQIYRARIYGDLDVEASDIVLMNLPPNIGLSGPDSHESDRRYSGHFLVSKVKHRIIISARTTCFTTLELLKGSLT